MENDGNSDSNGKKQHQYRWPLSSEPGPLCPLCGKQELRITWRHNKGERFPLSATCREGCGGFRPKQKISLRPGPDGKPTISMELTEATPFARSVHKIGFEALDKSLREFVLLLDLASTAKPPDGDTASPNG